MQDSIQNIQSEEYYKLVANNIIDLVALYSPDGILEYVSPSVHKLLGYEAENLVGTHPAAIVHPDERHLLVINEGAFREKKEEPVYFEYRVLHRDGRWLYYESYRQPIYNNEHELTNVLAVCREISQRKKAEQALLESEELYRRLADNILDLVVIYSPDGTRLYVSPSSYSFSGYRPEELVGKHFSDIVHPEDTDKIRIELEEKIAAGQDKFLIELRSRHKNGQWIYCETTTKALKDKNGNVTAFVSTTRDITGWKMAQMALKESEEKYRGLVESSDAMIAIVNKRGEFIFVNDKRAYFFEEKKENIIGKTAYDFYDEETAKEFSERIARAFEEKKKAIYENEITTKKNKTYWIRVTVQPVFDLNGDVSEVILNTIDITGIKYSEDALRKQNDVLKQIAFLQSHIVRSPLTNIQGILYLINEGGMDDENRYYFKLLKQAAEKLDEVIKEIVDRAVVIRHQTMDAQ